MPSPYGFNALIIESNTQSRHQLNQFCSQYSYLYATCSSDMFQNPPIYRRTNFTDRSRDSPLDVSAWWVVATLGESITAVQTHHEATSGHNMCVGGRCGMCTGSCSRGYGSSCSWVRTAAYQSHSSCSWVRTAAYQSRSRKGWIRSGRTNAITATGLNETTISFNNPLRVKFFRGNKNIYLHFVISPHWYYAGSWNPSSNKTRTYLFYIVNIMAADVQAT